MLILGIDTSTDIAAIGLIQKNELLGEFNVKLHHRHSERLLVNIDYVLKETNNGIKDLDGIAVGLGPGSFTGLRIGITTVKTIVQTLKIPVIGLSTLDILAFNKYQIRNWIVPVIDARRKRVYTSLYRGGNKDIKKNKIEEDKALSLKELNKMIVETAEKNKAEGIFHLVGAGVEVYRQQFEEFDIQSEFKVICSTVSDNIPRGGVIADLGHYYLEKGQQDKPETLLPNYLKKPQAEINW
ncbi:MAG: tRNA (adenosine(37)-N6)-threonylcarbamoyltransferase complex dimerization subunit type 1 TsaB [Bacillota bacterium]